MLETWKPVVGYEGLYEVSNLGRVKRLERVAANGHTYKELILQQSIVGESRDHLAVPLRKYPEKRKMLTVHRLVALAFIPNPDNLPVVDHIDGDPRNNNVNNLRWVTHSENIDNRPAYRELLAENERLKARVEELESEVKRCQTEVSQSQTLCNQFSIAFTKSD